MRPVSDSPRRRRRQALHAALVTLALAGCARDLAVPEPPTSPTITGVLPEKGYAGQLVFVTGEHLEPDATANTLNFAHASARGERWEAGRLVFRVPADAGDGPVTAGNRDGTSGAFGAFDYLGLGEPRRMQVASSRPILHRPQAVYAIAGDVVLLSLLYGTEVEDEYGDPLLRGGLVWNGSSALSADAIACSAVDPTRDAIYYANDLMQLFAIDATTGLALTAAPATLEAVPKQLLALPTQGVVLTFHDAGDYQITVTAWNSGTLAKVGQAATFGLEFFAGAADVGDGRVVVAGSAYVDTDYDQTLGVLDVAPILANAPTTATLLAPFPCDPIPPDRATCPPPSLGSNFSGTRIPFAVGGLGGPYAFAALDEGDVVIADLSANAFTAVAETWSPRAIESIAAGATSGVAIATKPGDDLSVIIGPPEAGTGVLLGSVPGDKPWVASAVGDLAFVANAGDNDVAVVNLETRARVGRVNFDVMPGAKEYGAAAAFVADASGVDGNVLFPSTAFPGLLRYDTYTGEPQKVSRAPGLQLLASAGEDRAVWTVADPLDPDTAEPPNDTTPPTFEGYFDGAWDSPPVTAALLEPTVIQRVAARDHLLAVAHDGGLALVDGDALPSATVTTATIDGATSPTFHGLGFTPDGYIWTVVARSADVQAQLWSYDPVAPALKLEGSWTVPDRFADPAATPPLDTAVSVESAAWLEDGLWVFWSDSEDRMHATLWDGSATGRTVAAADNLTTLHAVSPNGRLLVVRELSPSIPGFPLRFFRADPDAGFPEVRSLVFTERVEGFTFDATGERLYVLTQLPDRIITVD